MHWLDTSALFVMVGVAGFGLVMGLMGPLVRLLLVGLAFLIASTFTPSLIAAINKAPDTGQSNSAVLSLLFVISLTLLLTFFVLIRRWIWNSSPEFADSVAKFGWLDRLLGVVAGALLGFVGVALLLCLSIRVSQPEQIGRYKGSRMFDEAMQRIEPIVKGRPDAQKQAFKPMLDWLRKAGEPKPTTPDNNPADPKPNSKAPPTALKVPIEEMK